MIGSSPLMHIVCSKWADGLRSRVRQVHPSLPIVMFLLPILIIGSTAMHTVAKHRPDSLRPKLGTSGDSCIDFPMPWPHISRTTL